MRIQEQISALVIAIQKLPEDDQIAALNQARQALSEISPFKDEPVDCVVWEQQEHIQANDYNPNTVAPPEMKLLEHSIQEDGFTQPVVTYQKSANEYEVVDGFHRNRVARESEMVHTRVKGYLPITIINPSRTERKDRIAATIRHNRARGVHGVEPMANIVTQLYFNGWSNKRICQELGMEKDEVLRLKQFTGLGTLFENRNFSKAWEL